MFTSFYRFLTAAFLAALPALIAPAQEAAPAPTLNAVALQAALDRNGFGVGLIDGHAGARTQYALADFVKSRGLSSAEAQAALMADHAPALQRYTVTPADLGQVGAAPAEWVEASQVPAMAYTSLAEALSEKFHVSAELLQSLNPGIGAWDASAVSNAITVLNVKPVRRTVEAAALEVDCTRFRVRVLDSNAVPLASFPCSIAMDLARVPTGDLRVVAFAPNPTYTFDPANYPESPAAQAVGRRLVIPPGPNNPVGAYWLSLNRPGFGMHGTPHPETIGRAESHGCFRLTNWDIARLARWVAAGTPVRVTGLPAE